MLTLREFYEGENGRDQSEGYSSKWLIWLLCRAPLIHTYHGIQGTILMIQVITQLMIHAMIQVVILTIQVMIQVMIQAMILVILLIQP